MRVGIVALALAVLAVGSHATTIRVSTFNVLCQACAMTDERFERWSTRLTYFEDLFARQPCDIYGIQELIHRYNVQEILDVLPKDTYAALYFNETGWEVIDPYYPDSAIFYDTEVFSVVSQGQYWLSETPERPSMGWTLSLPRLVAWAVFKHIEDGTEFYFSSTHFDNNGPNKIPSATLHLERGGAMAAQGLPVIAVGDYNSDFTSDSYALLTTGVDDSFVYVNSFDLASDPHFEGPEDPIGYGCHNTLPDHDYPNCLIDHVFFGVGPSPASRYNVTEWVVDTTLYEGKLPSDHRLHAVTVTF